MRFWAWQILLLTAFLGTVEGSGLSALVAEIRAVYATRGVANTRTVRGTRGKKK